MVKMLARLPGENNNNYTYRSIKEGILSLELKPGQLLCVGELSEALKVSSTPIKNALWKLHQEQLVDVIPQVGSYVSEINLELVEEAAFMWFNLEKETLKLACDFFPENRLKQLKKNLNDQEILINQKSMLANQVEWTRKLNELDDHFHATIFDGLHKKNTWNAISQMSSNYHRMINLTGISSHHEHLIAEHREILSIIEKKELERVDGVLKNHILKPLNNWGSVYKKDICL